MLDLHGKKHAWILGGFEYLRADTDVEANPGSGGAVFKGDADAGGSIHPYTKVEFGASGTQTPVSATNPLPVGGSGAAALGKAEDAAHASGDVGVPMLLVRRDTAASGVSADGDYAVGSCDANGLMRVNGSGVNQPVTDAGGSLTFDTNQLPSAVGQNAAADSLSVVLASDGTLPLMTGAATAANQSTGNTALAAIQAAVEGATPAGDNNIGNVDIASHPAGSLAGVTAKTSDYDTGAGEDTVPMMGLALPASGGAVAGGTSTNPVRTDPTGTTPQPITDNGGSITTDFDGQSTPGSAAPSAGVAVTGSDGTNARHLRTDSDGHAQVDTLTQPARARTTDSIAAGIQTDAIMNGLTALTPKFAAIDAASSGDNTVVAAVTDKKIRVLACFLIGAAAVTVRFESGAGGTALTGQMNVGANSGFVLPFNPAGWFETAASTLLNLELGGAVSVDGCLTYVEV